MEEARKPRLRLGRILEMNVGFLGLQFSFGLQQGNMAPIYSYLGAREAALPLLLLAGPITGLIVQPLIGAMSDRTLSRWGRRTPYFVAGAALCSLSLFAMPFSSSLVMAASLLWVLDAANNVTLEPYRAYVSDRLQASQHQVGFLTQSAFTGLAQTLAYLTPSLLVVCGLSRDAVDAHGIPLVTCAAFLIGSVLSIATILWSVFRVRELPLSAREEEAIRRRPDGMAATLAELKDAMAQMPRPMRRMAAMCLFQWAGFAAYWSYVVYAIGRSIFATSDPHSSGFRQAVLLNGEVGAFFNLVAFVSAFAMTPLARRHGPRLVHAASLLLAGVAMIALPRMRTPEALFLPAVGIGIGWASMMGNPYVMLADSVPPERTGVYMGIFNVFIVIPMLLLAAIVPALYGSLLGGDPRHVLELAGVMMILGAAATLSVPAPRNAASATPKVA